MSEDTEREQAEAVALAHMMGYADAEGAARAKVERLEARVAELEAALSATYAHLLELREAWQRGVIREHDGTGGFRSNRNVEVIGKVRAALKGGADER